MKKHSYGKLISMSWYWMVQILFRPFSLKKWIMLGIIILLAGQMGGGGGGGGGKKADSDKFKKVSNTELSLNIEAPVPSEFSVQSEKPNDIIPSVPVFPQPKNMLRMLSSGAPIIPAPLALLLIAILLFVGLMIILWMWVVSNFSFVFIDSIVKNDASLRVPYHRNKPQGRSYFYWIAIFSSIAILTFGIIICLPIMQLVKAGIFMKSPPVDFGSIFSIILPYLFAFIITIIVFALIGLAVKDFILPIMYRRKIGILAAWSVFLNLFKKNIGEILLYLLVKIGLSILALIAAIIILIIGAIGVAVIALLFILVSWLIYTITPQGAKVIVLIILVATGIPAFIFLGFLFNLLFIPIPIFFRIFSIHVLGSIDESLDLFAPKTREEIVAEGDDEKYRKSMRLVWFTALSPALFIIILLLAIAIPNFQRARHRAFDIKMMKPFQKIPSLQEIPPLKGKGENFVTVYLKNGNSFTAEIERESEQNISFRVEGGIFILPRSDILRIEK